MKNNIMNKNLKIKETGILKIKNILQTNLEINRKNYQFKTYVIQIILKYNILLNIPQKLKKII